jgi:fibronectin-binding autotransporter adhesin
MNRIYRLVWSESQQTWLVASELATRRGKRGRSRGAVVGGLVASLLAMSAQVHAADLYWDANGTSLGLGGAGTWDLSDAFWGASIDGVSGPYSIWDNAALNNAIFNGTAATLTLGTLTAHDLTFNVNGYVLNSGTLQVALEFMQPGPLRQDLQIARRQRIGACKVRLGLLRPTLTNEIDGEVQEPVGANAAQLERAPEMPLAGREVIELRQNDAQQRMNLRIARLRADRDLRGSMCGRQIAARESVAGALQR